MKNTTIILSIMIVIIILSQNTIVNASSAFDINKSDPLSNFEFKFSINFPYNPAPNENINISVLYAISYNSSIPKSQMYPFVINTIIINLDSPSLGLLASMNISSMFFSKTYALQQYGITSTPLFVSSEFQQTPLTVQILIYMNYKITSSNTTIPMSFFLSSNTLINLYEAYSLGEILFIGIIAVTITLVMIFMIGFFVDRFKTKTLIKRIRDH